MDAETDAQHSLACRPAAASVINEVLRVQADAAPRGNLARLFGRSPLRAESRSWYKGAHGEIEVGSELARLPGTWTVLHAVPVGTGDSDIDHILIGPPGVFTINTKNHSGAKVFAGGGSVSVNGQRQDHIRNSLHEASRAAKLLAAAGVPDTAVTPLIVVVRPASLTIGSTRPKVVVLTSRQLLTWLGKQKPLYSDAELERIRAAAVLPSTWRKPPLASEDFADQRARFDVLSREVSSAAVRMRLWVGGLMLAVAGALIAGAGHIPTLIAGFIEALIL